MKFIIANWKMALGVRESIDLAKQICEKWRLNKQVELVLCPDFCSIWPVEEIIRTLRTKISLSGQDIFWEQRGSYTGEISGAVLRETGCKYVLIGHSERRQYLQETDEMVNKKTKTALAARLIPIVCVGETWSERQQGKTEAVLKQQISVAFRGISSKEISQCFIAYEPVWAIGTGKPVAPAEANRCHIFIKKVLNKFFSAEIVAKKFFIIYGGSVTKNNIKQLLQQPVVDGALIGGASQQAKEFLTILKYVTTK